MITKKELHKRVNALEVAVEMLEVKFDEVFVKPKAKVVKKTTKKSTKKVK